jgi:hypothetical protein
VFADRRPEAIAHLRAALDDEVTTRVGLGTWDELVTNARSGGLVVNATGMGKDRPGAPPVTVGSVSRGLSRAWANGSSRQQRLCGPAPSRAAARLRPNESGMGVICHSMASR